MDGSVCVSYPKSGRTWLRVLMADLRVSMGFTHLDAGADKKSWGKRHSNLRTPKVSQRKIIFLHRDPRDTVVLPCRRTRHLIMASRR